MRLSKPAPGHNRLLGPAACMCVDCCRVMLDKRCPAVDPEMGRCGDYRGHRGSHTAIPATVWLIAEERIRLDSPSRAVLVPEDPAGEVDA